MKMQWVTRVRMFAGACTLALCGTIFAQGVPEPGIVLYGKVWEDGALVTAGDLTWTYASRDGTVTVQVSAMLQPLETAAGDTFSYRVDLAAESPLPGGATSANTLPATVDSVTYTRVVMIDGIAAAIAGDAGTDTFCLEKRGKIERLDVGKNGSSIPTCGISGSVDYDGRQPGDTVIQIFDNEGFSGLPVYELVAASEFPVEFAAADLLSGAYYLRAFKDDDGDGNPGDVEAYGEFAGHPVMVPPDAVALMLSLRDVDSDDDGLPDWWEWQQFGGLAQDPDDDFDGDGESNADEYAHQTHAADARSTHDPANAYRQFTFCIWREAAQTGGRTAVDDRWGIDLVCAVEQDWTVLSGTLTKPALTVGENPVDLDVHPQAGTAFLASTEYQSFEELSADAVAGTYQVHLTLEDETGAGRDLRFDIVVPEYDVASFPDYIAIEAPAPGANDVSIAPLVSLSADNWDFLWIREPSGSLDQYSYGQTAGDSDQHQVPDETLAAGTAYNLRVRAFDGLYSGFASVTRSEFTTAPAEATYTVTFVAEADGSLAGELSQRVEPGGATTAVIARANPGFSFHAWMLDEAHYSTWNPLWIGAVSADMALVATFVPAPHDADQNGDWKIQLSPELTRQVQFLNSGGYHVQPGTEDGFGPGPGSTAGPFHDADQNGDWRIQISPELTRMVQFFNAGGYHLATGTEDGYAPGPVGVKSTKDPGKINAAWSVRRLSADSMPTVTIDLTIGHTDPAAVQSVAVLGQLPRGWRYAGIAQGPLPEIRPSPGVGGDLGFVWIGMPSTWPLRLAVLLQAVEGDLVPGRIGGVVRHRENGAEQSMALPDLDVPCR